MLLIYCKHFDNDLLFFLDFEKMLRKYFSISNQQLKILKSIISLNQLRICYEYIKNLLLFVSSR